MKYVVVIKTYGEAERTKENMRFPDEWPKECAEFDSEEAARDAYPGRPVITTEQYAHFARGLAIAHSLIPELNARRWWQFWK